VSEYPEPQPAPHGQFLVYPSDNELVKIEVRLEDETVWLTQQHMADLFQTTKQNVSLHLQHIYAEGELERGATVKESLTVRRRKLPRELLPNSVVKNFFTTAANHAGKISHDMAIELAEEEYEKYNRQRIEESDRAGGDFDRAIKQLPSLSR